MSKQSFSVLEGVITVGALVTSAAAVYIAWDQAVTMRVEQHASVLPAIQIDYYEDFSNTGLSFGFTVENAGVGPAFVHSAKIYNGDVAFSGFEEISSSLPLETAIKPTQLSGRVIAPGVKLDGLSILRKGFAMTPDSANEITSATLDWVMEVCYCSTLDRCWVSKSNQRVHALRVDSCEAPNGKSFF